MKRLVDSKSLEIDNLDNLPACESCLKEKMTRKPFVGQSTLANGLLDLINSNFCGQLNTKARRGFFYFITFIDDHSRYGYVYLIRYKSEAFVRFKEFRFEVENQTFRKIKTLRPDRGGEYLSGEFIDYLKKNGIVSQWTPPVMPQLNGVAERRNRTLLDMIRSARVPQAPERYGFLGMTSQLDNDPKTYGEAMSDIDSKKWLEAMKFEMDSMSLNQVWTLVDRPKGVRSFGCKWVYKRKIGADREMDVKTTFLNGFVEEEIYMDQPEGFTIVREEQKVFHLQRSIYGLKQASRSWNIHFDEVIWGYDFVKNNFYHCV
ncbi:hypothetical protein Sango_2317400 [Sesamum angolense]|uniref:Integrase catalytic domain-containing protein n=1 Tax=Sesamum angolense TaxID=2727404 RepID=A0AAE1WAV3_9LAMI|nr:hypothetical protein Sango_2317400 [Sesamum angolense]